MSGLIGFTRGQWNCHDSSRKCRPVRRTNTSSRLACRVVKCSSLAPCRETASSSAGMVTWGWRTVKQTSPPSAWTDSTPGKAAPEVFFLGAVG